MCGIVACRSQDATGDLLQALKVLEYRGYDSVGIAVRTVDGGTATFRTVDRIDALTERVRAWRGEGFGQIGIGHTRWATHGAVTESNAHPHLDCHGRISVVHNGIIENAARLRDELEGLGHVFASEVDSEVMCHLVEDALLETGDVLSAVTKSLDRLVGSWAFVVMDALSGRMIAAANRSPLIVARSRRGDFVASDVAAVAEWVDEFRVMNDGDVVEISDTPAWTHGGIAVDAPKAVKCSRLGRERPLADHEDHMGKEIDEQPEVAARILDELAAQVADGSLWRSLDLPSFDRVVTIGCGTSLNAGRVIGMAFSRLGGVPNTAVVASEATEHVVEPRTLVLAISQSGETADVLRAIEHFASSSCSLLAFTNNRHSTLGRRADSVVDCLAGQEIGVAATKTFVAQVVTGVAFAMSALVSNGQMDRADARRSVDDLYRLPDLIAQSIAISKERVPAFAGQFRDAPGFLFLGRGAGVVYAAEGALKLKELSYRWAEHYPAGELKHGPLALVEKGTPVVVIDNDDPRLWGNIAEVQARGGTVIRVGGMDAEIPVLGRGTVRPLTGGMSSWGPLEAVVPLQILARELAIALGKDVDKPRNLAKSVTVE